MLARKMMASVKRVKTMDSERSNLTRAIREDVWMSGEARLKPVHLITSK